MGGFKGGNVSEGGEGRAEVGEERKGRGGEQERYPIGGHQRRTFLIAPYHWHWYWY